MAIQTRTRSSNGLDDNGSNSAGNGSTDHGKRRARFTTSTTDRRTAPQRSSTSSFSNTNSKSNHSNRTTHTMKSLANTPCKVPGQKSYSQDRLPFHLHRPDHTSDPEIKLQAIASRRKQMQAAQTLSTNSFLQHHHHERKAPKSEKNRRSRRNFVSAGASAMANAFRKKANEATAEIKTKAALVADRACELKIQVLTDMIGGNSHNKSNHHNDNSFSLPNRHYTNQVSVVHDTRLRCEIHKEFRQYIDTTGTRTATLEEMLAFVRSTKTGSNYWNLLREYLGQDMLSDEECQDTAVLVMMELGTGLKGKKALKAGLTKRQYCDFKMNYFLDPEGKCDFLYRMVFAAFDLDCSGALDYDELDQFLDICYRVNHSKDADVSLALPPKEELKAKVLEKLDQDGNGTFTYEEIQGLVGRSQQYFIHKELFLEETTKLEDDDEDCFNNNNNNNTGSLLHYNRCAVKKDACFPLLGVTGKERGALAFNQDMRALIGEATWRD